MSVKNYLVTGGTGFIGAAIVSRLVHAGNTVRVLDNNSRGSLTKLGEIAKEVEFFQADIRDGEAVKQAASGMDSILHLAYINGTEFFYQKPELILDVAVRGMLSVLDACKTHQIGELVLASSSEAYQTPPYFPTDEKVPLSIPDVLNPRYSYGGGKLICELMAINYGRKDFERVMVFRPHNVYGPNMGFEHVIPQLALRALDVLGKQPAGPIEFPIQGDGSQTRAFIYIDDFAEGIMRLLETGKHLEIYNLGTEEEVSISQLVESLFAYFKREVNIKAGTPMPGATNRRCPDIRKIAALGFKPTISLSEGIAKTVPWYEQYYRQQEAIS